MTRHFGIARWDRRLRTIPAMVFVAGLVPLPAAADPAGPTHYRSTITQVEATDGGEVPLEVEVLGGDSFLVVEAEPGTLVEVPGYDGEPYLRIEPDGTVMVNERSPARWINDARYGAAETQVPATADAKAPPSWVPVADGGEYAWHDHRIHYMSPSLPNSVESSRAEVQPVFDWGPVPLLVDDREVRVSGELVWVPGPPPLVPVVLVLAALVVSSLLFLRRPGSLAPVLLVTAAVTALAGSSGVVGLPPGSDGRTELLVLPAIAAAITMLRVARRRGEDAGWLTPAAGLPLLIWGVLQSGAQTRPIVPGSLTAGWVRGASALALGVGAAALVVLLRRLVASTRRDVATELG